MITPEEFKELKERVRELNKTGSRLEGKLDESRKSLKQILKKHDVKSLSDFKEKLETDKEKASALVDEIVEYVKTIQEQLTKVEAFISETGEENA